MSGQRGRVSRLPPTADLACLCCKKPMVKGGRKAHVRGGLSHRARGLCFACYSRARSLGILADYPPVGARTAPVADRLWARVEARANGCREWTGGTSGRGYGHITIEGKKVYAHRLAWQLTNGPIPDGMYVCHHCDNPPCCNPAHLFLGTPSDNNADMRTKGRNARTLKTHCKRGHEFTEENTRLALQRGRAVRHCRACDKQRRHADDPRARRPGTNPTHHKEMTRP